MTVAGPRGIVLKLRELDDALEAEAFLDEYTRTLRRDMRLRDDGVSERSVAGEPSIGRRLTCQSLHQA